MKYTSKYWLFLLIGRGIMLFCLFQKKKTLSKGRFLSLMIVGVLCILYTAVITLETFIKPNGSITPVMAGIMNAMLITIYVLLFAIGVTIVSYALVRYLKMKNAAVFEHLAIILFTLVCLAFGIYVSYSDFWDGKQIICYLTMAIYVGCLLIYRPHITILILVASFGSFYSILLTFQDGLFLDVHNFKAFNDQRGFEAGDSLTTLTMPFRTAGSYPFTNRSYGRTVRSCVAVRPWPDGSIRHTDCWLPTSLSPCWKNIA